MSIVTLAERAAAVDGVEPFNEASLFALRDGSAARILVQQTEADGTISAAAFAVGDAPVEIVVDPAHRRTGKGRRILDELLADGEDHFWAHGDLPAAQALAASAGLSAERILLVLRLTFDGPPAPERVPDGITLRSYVPERCRRGHRGQRAGVRRSTLSRARWTLRTSPGVRRRRGSILPGCSWPSGTAGSSGSTGPRSRKASARSMSSASTPTRRAADSARRSRRADCATCTSRALPIVDLYVEGDNAPALKVYRNLGFKDWKKDVLYSR